MAALQSVSYDNFDRIRSRRWQSTTEPVLVASGGPSVPRGNVVSFRGERPARSNFAELAKQGNWAELISLRAVREHAGAQPLTVTLAKGGSDDLHSMVVALRAHLRGAGGNSVPTGTTELLHHSQADHKAPAGSHFKIKGHETPPTAGHDSRTHHLLRGPMPGALPPGHWKRPAPPPATGGGSGGGTETDPSPSVPPLTTPTTDGASAATRDAIDAWNQQWRGQAAAMPCGTCAGRACMNCSFRLGQPSPGPMPTGYSPFVPMNLTQQDSTQDLGAAAPMSFQAAAAPSLLAATTTNPIVLENQKQGSPESEWMVSSQDPTIEGFAAQFSLNHGQTVDFKINTDSTNYRIDIYRLGYYGGMGARKVGTINQSLTTAQVQPVPLFDADTRLVDAGNWSVSASWAVPSDAVSGVYFAKLTRLDGSGGANMIPFIVRDDEAPSDITFQTSDTTWQAYNWWGGYNFYGGIDDGGRDSRAFKVSYNRPITTREGGFSAGPQDFIFGAEYPAIRWLEQNGYDVNYITGIDTARSGAQLLNGKIFMSVGHDEYWSADQRTNVEAARDAGVNLAFLSGNEVYWEVRWESDANGTPYKTLVSYKERWADSNIDTQGTTSTWRDFELGAGKPENALTGTIFTVDSHRLDSIQIPYDLSQFRFWSNTAVANISPGQVYSLTPNLLGYEWDSDLDNGFRPAGLVPLSSTTLNVESKLLDYGNTVGSGTSTHSLTLYRAPSGALVFGAGSVYWVWGLDSHHDNEVTPVDRNVQQAMVNLFADMGVQPSTLMASLQIASQTTDHTAPVSVITSPTSSTGGLLAGVPITITGTATDIGGGRVAVVEVSIDGGTKWYRATGVGTNSWSYTFTPLAAGNYTIKTRAVDDSLNMEAPGAGRTITVGAAPVISFFSTSSVPAVTSDVDKQFVNLGMRFTSSQSGTIVGIRYYKGIGDGGEHVGSLWSSTGQLLASATFTGETASGWQTLTFSNPVAITAGTTYTVSYLSHGHYAYSDNTFNTPLTVGSLTASNGYYTYSGTNAFPTTSAGGGNYWVDVIFSSANTPNDPPIAVNDDGRVVFKDTPTTFTVASLLANDSDPNGDPLTFTGVGSATGGTVTFNSQAQTVTFTPTAGYTGTASFNYSISDGRGGTASASVNISVVPQAVGVSLFGANETPAQPSSSDTAQVNLGMRFVASASGTITGIKYYKSANDTGTHTGTLWSSTGTLLGTVTFTNETSSGWQTATFTNPIAITAGTTYVVSYHSNGHYASTAGYFATTKTNGPLSAGTTNGVFTYGTGNLFPTDTYANTNYWVDVLFQQGTGANQPPTAVNDTGLTGSKDTTLQINASQLLANDTDPDGDPLTITGVSSPTNGTVSFNAQTNVISFTPTAGFTGTAGFTYSISDGRGGTSSAAVSITFGAPPTGTSLFNTSQTPGTVTVNDANQVELGMKFTVSSAGSITGVKFYKGPQNTGAHTGRVWTSTGTLLGTVTFTNETASGWQTATFSNPIAVTAGTTYVVSYHTNGYYSADGGYFNSSVTNGAITAPSSSSGGGNGVFAYGPSAFPNSTFNATNYWVDVLFRTNSPPQANDDSGFTTLQGTPLQISAASLLGNDTHSDGAPLTITGVSAPTNGTVSFNAQTNIITFTPNAGYTGAAQFNYSISDGFGGTASAKVSLTVNAPAAPPPSPVSLFSSSATPASVTVNDTQAVTLGMKFTASANGTISGIRFYKGPQNTGTHTGSLWTSTGTNLGNVTFTNETASGWQTASFATPISVTAGTTYVVSYHTNAGFYSASGGFFTSATTNGPLTAPSSSSSGGNGVYAYGSANAFPTSSYNSTNYWVDVVFNQLAG